MQKRLRAVCLLAAVLGLSPGLLFGLWKSKLGMTYHILPNQQAIVEHPSIVRAERPCENWMWAAALDSLLQAKQAATGQEYQILRLYGGDLCAEVKSYAELGEKISHEYTMPDGRKFLLQAQYTEGAPSLLEPVIVAMKDQHPLMLVWKHHPYVLVGIVYDEYVALNGSRLFKLKELRLIDPATGQALSFFPEKDDAASINGVMNVTVTPLQLYQMR